MALDRVDKADPRCWRRQGSLLTRRALRLPANTAIAHDIFAVRIGSDIDLQDTETDEPLLGHGGQRIEESELQCHYPEQVLDRPVLYPRD